MERALRVLIVLAVIALALWVPKYLQDNPVAPELERLQGELRQLEMANQQVIAENDEYRTLVRGLREVDGVLDRRARESLDMSRSDEIVIYFGDEDDSALSLR